jgi:Tfp pilus assembly protein PilV
MTVVLMGTALLAVMDAAIAGITASNSTRNVAQVETVLQNAADRVNRAPQSCSSYKTFVEAATSPVHWNRSQAVATYQWYEANADAKLPGVWHPGACQGTVVGLDVQLVTITVTSPDGKATRSMQVVKSNV